MKQTALSNLLVLLITIVLCLVVGEVVFRVADGYRLDRLALVIEERGKGRTGTTDSMSYAERLKLDPGFPVSWYKTSPQDYDRSNNYSLPPDWVKAVANYKPAPEEPAFIKNELKFLYNYNWLVDACKSRVGTRVIRHYAHNPGFVYAFASPDSSTAPQYRIVPRGWNEGNDSYNNFGFRGPDISPNKAARTIRIAFLGASTTAQGWPFTYPEYTVHFLRLWSAAMHLNVDFDVINGGRAGLDSTGIAEIMRYEVAPLHPDIVVYDGATNDFDISPYVRFSGNAPSRPTDRGTTGASFQVQYLPLEQYSAFLDRIYELLLRRGGPEAENSKPSHTLTFDFSQKDPNLNERQLPFRLNGQIKDIREIAATTAEIHAQLFLDSAIAVPHAGMHLEPEADRYILQELDANYWPITYAEFHEALDFQNRVYEKLAQTDHYSYLDVAKYFPQDPKLFSDLFHFRNQDGERLEGWIVAQLLAPHIKHAIQSHQLPKPADNADPKAISWARARPIRFSLACLRK